MAGSNIGPQERRHMARSRDCVPREEMGRDRSCDPLVRGNRSISPGLLRHLRAVEQQQRHREPRERPGETDVLHQIFDLADFRHCRNLAHTAPDEPDALHRVAAMLLQHQKRYDHLLVQRHMHQISE